MKSTLTQIMLKKLAAALYHNNIDAYNCEPIYKKLNLSASEISQVEKYYDVFFKK
jgi:hypothetical protein